jgi:hypothetical protein
MTQQFPPARFPLDPCPDDFMQTAKLGWNLVANLPVSVNRAFELVTDANLEREWFPNYKNARWSAEPGVGVEREYELSYMRIIERFTIWEPGSRFQFWVSSCSLPILQRFAEDYRFLERSPRETGLYWSIRYEPRRELRALRPMLSPLFAKDFRLAIRRIEALAVRDSLKKHDRNVEPNRSHGAAP